LDVLLGTDVDGRDLCKEIRKFNGRVPIILMSGRSDFLKDYEQYGANDVIEKPFDFEELLNKIDWLLA